MAVIFLLASFLLSTITVIALNGTEGTAYMLVLTTAIFPFLMLVIAALRVLVTFSRKISLVDDVLHHIQTFKTHHVPLRSIQKVEAIEREDETVVTLRVIWTGPHWYLDHRSVEDWDILVSRLKQALPTERWIVVDEFQALESS